MHELEIHSFIWQKKKEKKKPELRAKHSLVWF